MPHRPLLAPILLLASLALLTDCGGYDDDEDSAGAATTAAASETPSEPDKIVFMAGFKPQANLPFVGAYVAQEKGFFEEENLDVEIRHSNPGENFRFLASGEAHISTADATAVLERWTGDPALNVVSVALIGQTGQQGFATLTDAGLASPTDWAGKTAGFKGATVTPDYLAVLEANGVDRASVQEVKVGFEPQVLTEGVVDIFPVFVANEPDTLERLGYPTDVVTAADYGAPTLGLTYVAMEGYVVDNSDIVQRFVRAALRGIEYADENREEAVVIVMQYAPQEDPEHQRYMLDTELDMAKSGEGEANGIGYQTEEQWQALHDYLIEHGGLPKAVEDITRVFAPDFTEE
jgi:ABC-type nitrate/sulfonate/bicarbonate transport system substrate-binding protein